MTAESTISESARMGLSLFVEGIWDPTVFCTERTFQAQLGLAFGDLVSTINLLACLFLSFLLKNILINIGIVK